MKSNGRHFIRGNTVAMNRNLFIIYVINTAVSVFTSHIKFEKHHWKLQNISYRKLEIAHCCNFWLTLLMDKFVRYSIPPFQTASVTHFSPTSLSRCVFYTEMSKYLWFSLVIFACSLGQSSSTWWSPFQWREYWQDWFSEPEKGQTQPQNGKPEILPNGQG